MNLKALILAAVVSIGLGARAQAGLVKVEASGSFSPFSVSYPAQHPNFDSNADWSLSFLYDMDAVAELVSTVEVVQFSATVRNLDLRLNNQPVAVLPEGSNFNSISYIRLQNREIIQRFETVIRLDPSDPMFVGSASDRGTFQFAIHHFQPLAPLLTDHLDLGSVNLAAANTPEETRAQISLLLSSGRAVAQSRDIDDAEAVLTAVPAPLPLAGMGAIALRRLG